MALCRKYSIGTLYALLQLVCHRANEAGEHGRLGMFIAGGH
jgi:hypothetical protein